MLTSPVVGFLVPCGNPRPGPFLCLNREDRCGCLVDDCLYISHDGSVSYSDLELAGYAFGDTKIAGCGGAKGFLVTFVACFARARKQ